jgi:IS30 family transposase
MVAKFKVKNPLTIEERRKIKEGLALQMSYSELALHVGRCKSVVMRESKRLGYPWDYEPDLAQKNFEAKQKLSGIKRGSDLYIKIAKEENLHYA